MTITRIPFQTAMRAAAVQLLTDFKADMGIALQIYPGRPRTIYPPSAFVDSIDEALTTVLGNLNDRNPTVSVVVVHGVSSTRPTRSRSGTSFVDAFIEWVTDQAASGWRSDIAFCHRRVRHPELRSRLDRRQPAGLLRDADHHRRNRPGLIPPTSLNTSTRRTVGAMPLRERRLTDARGRTGTAPRPSVRATGGRRHAGSSEASLPIQRHTGRRSPVDGPRWRLRGARSRSPADPRCGRVHGRTHRADALLQRPSASPQRGSSGRA
jgi:hypothetical protein